MPKVSLDMPTLPEYTSLGDYLQSFSDITQIDAMFYGLSGIFVHKNHVFTDEKLIQQQLDLEQMINYTIFPVTYNANFWGFILCNSEKVSQQRIKLSKDYLSNVFQQVFSEAHNCTDSKVLDPLSKDEFSQINYLSILLKMSPRVQDKGRETEANETQIIYNRTESYASLKKASEYVLQNIVKPLSLNEVANKVYLSPSYLSRLFKKYLNVTFVDYVNHIKIARAKEKLALTTHPINVIAADVGFTQTSYFTKTFKKMTGTTPSKFRRQNTPTAKIFTIPHTIDWTTDDTVFDVSKRFFNKQGIDFFYQTANTFLYVNSIDNLTDSAENRGWLFTIDGQQPTKSVNEIPVQTISEIQWLYTDLQNI
ncbi:helix-turn-helix domain-containing protein [uncultured Secundilactobacillus sp.]|uniref:helix-turn-helix domain-containing protein n=1 Tax=uncultured Secundilactobacillus sp. TaxID=2813935 RepID=UPI00258857DF|nr:helix-turn-helix domain-containing protein [uncultured Secundilactobacillus sp.]